MKIRENSVLRDIKNTSSSTKNLRSGSILSKKTSFSAFNSQELPRRAQSTFKNLGNTCFMTATMQCLIHTSSLRSFFLSQLKHTRKDSKLRGRLAEEFQKVVFQMNSMDLLDISEVKSLLSERYGEYTGFEQEDACEFLRYLLEALHEDLNRARGKQVYREMPNDFLLGIRTVADEWWEYTQARENSVITDVFRGQLLSVVKCQNCLSKSLSCDSFLNLALPLAGNTLGDSFRSFTRNVSLPGYVCEKCKTKGKSCQSVSLYRLPQVLVIQLKRFKLIQNKKVKLKQALEIPHTLNLRKFAKMAKGRTSYTLFAVVHHLGGLTAGHYRSECANEGNWLRFDDSKIFQIKDPTLSSSAYVLFYQRI